MTHFVHLQYCYDYLINQIPVGLLLYSHIPTALIALLFGILVFIKEKTLVSANLFIVCLFFAISCFLDLSSWFAFLGASTTMFTWSLLGMVSLIFFLFSYYFLYTFITKRDLPLWQKLTGLAILLPTIIWTFLGKTLSAFDLNTCEAREGVLSNNYLFIAEGIVVLAVIFLTIRQYRKSNNRAEKREINLAGIGVSVFLLFFLLSTLIVSLFVNYETFVGYVYNIEIYGLFGMPILLGLLMYLVVKYRAFNLKVFSAQALVIALVVLVGSQFAFLSGTASRILNGATFVMVGIVGIYLIKGVRREIEQKEKLAILSQQLEESNEKLKSLDKLKTEFLSLASHQLRSPLTAIKGYASMLDEGSLGKITPEQSTAAKRIYSSAQGLVNLVEDLLNVSKIEQGGMKYEMMPVELTKVVTDLAGEMKIPAENKRLELRTAIEPNDAFAMTADPTKIKQVFLNLVDNSIKYTATGFVEIGLKRGPDKQILFTVKDSGVGVTPETKAKLFQKFSRGGEGSKMNTGGSGLGLYLAQEIVKAHKGSIAVDSEGLGKGTTFTVTLPAA